MTFPLKPLKHVATLNDEVLDERTSPDWEVRYAEVSDVAQGAPIRWKEPTKFEDVPTRARRIARDGDILVSTVRTYLRAVTQVVNPPPGAVVSTGLAVVRPVTGESRYLGYALQADRFIDEVVARSTGVSYPAIASAEIARIKVPSPSIPTQRAIADYLDHETAEIDAFIADQVALIKLLKERRLATIDSQLRFADGALTPLKHLGKLRPGITMGAKYSQETQTYPYLRVANVQTDHVDLTDIATTEVPLHVAESTRLVPGDVLMTEGGDRDKLGRGALWKEDVDDMLHQNHVFAFRTNGRLSPAYLVYVLESTAARYYFDVTAKQSTNLASTNSTLVKNFRLPISDVETQDAIVASLDSECRALADAIRDAQLTIDLSQERRAALISAAVTGQVDVSQRHRPVVEQLEDEVLERV